MLALGLINQPFYFFIALTDRFIATTERCSITPISLAQALGALLYEAVLLFGVLFFVSALTHTLWPAADEFPGALRIAMFFVLGFYFTWCWHKTGQTLAMKTWHVRLVGDGSGPIGWGRAALRYGLAWWLLLPGYVAVFLADLKGVAALLALIVGFVVAWGMRYVDPQHRGLHDRIAKTRLESAFNTKDRGAGIGG